MDNSLFPTIPVLLERSSLDQKWGFRLQGGADFRFPLSIKKVTANSPAYNKLHPGDGLLFIDGQDINTMKHEHAETIFRNALRLQVILRRGQYAIARPAKAPVKFSGGSTPRTNSTLNKTVTPNNYRRF